jgi:hypothetical protein
MNGNRVVLVRLGGLDKLGRDFGLRCAQDDSGLPLALGLGRT